MNSPKIRLCPKCDRRLVIKDGYCPWCREYTMTPIAEEVKETSGLYALMCGHHSDAERKKATCPVCLQQQLLRSGWQRITETNRPKQGDILFRINHEGTKCIGICYRVVDLCWTHFIYPPPPEPPTQSSREKWLEEYMRTPGQSSFVEIVNDFAAAALNNPKLLEKD